METTKFGFVAFVHDISDGVYDYSDIVLFDDWKELDAYNDEDHWTFDENGVFALTKDGREHLDQYKEDCSYGYDLCYGRATGLASEYYNAYDFFGHLTLNTDYAESVPSALW